MPFLWASARPPCHAGVAEQKLLARPKKVTEGPTEQVGIEMEAQGGREDGKGRGKDDVYPDLSATISNIVNSQQEFQITSHSW